jgi:hypothetical protein
MPESESADNCIERIISKWEMFYVSFTKIDGRVQSPRQFYHLRRQVDADCARALICGFGCESARSGRDVQQTCTKAQMHRIDSGFGPRPSRTLHMGNDDPGLRWHWLNGVSSQVEPALMAA